MAYGRHPYGAGGYAGNDVAAIPDDQTDTALSVEVAFTTGALEVPVWEDVTDDVRAWDTSRGRSRELERMQPGRATVVLSNLDRQYDSANTAGPHYGNLKPMRRIRIRETFNGVTWPVFDGFVDRWHLDYPGMGHDATATVVATDGFKVFARDDLPRSVYDDEVLADAPDLYWRLDEVKTSEEDATLVALNAGTLSSAADGTYVGPPRLGDEGLVVNDPATSMAIVNPADAAGTVEMGVTIEGSDFSLYGPASDSFVFEAWCMPQNTPGTNGFLVYQDNDASAAEIIIFYTLSQTWALNAFPSGGSAGASVPGPFPPHLRYHIVVRVVIGQANQFWVNGALTTGATPTGTFGTPGSLHVGHQPGTPGNNWSGLISHVAVYRGATADAVDQAWVDRHYAAGTHPWQDDQPADRADRVLDLAGWPSDRRELDTGNVALQSADIGGQTALEHFQKIGETEFGLVYMTRDGKARLAGREALFGRDPGPVVFGDGSGEVGHRGLTFDDGDAVIRNRATVSRLNGAARTAVDTGSENEFGPFDYALDGLLHRLDTYSQDYANLIVGEYAEPRRRVTSLALGPPAAGAEATLYPAMLGHELGDAIVVKDTPPGGGARFEQTCVVEGITHAWDPHSGRTAAWVLSPEFSVRALEEEDVATLGYAQVVADQAGITSEVDLTGLTVNVTVGADRYVRITGYADIASDTDGSIPVLQVKEGATVLARCTFELGDATAVAQTAQVVAVLDSPSAGAHTYKLTLLRAGAGSLTLAAAGARPAFILVEDIGPV